MESSPGRRAAAYWYVDGFPEVVFGLALLLSAACGLFCRLYELDPWVAHYLAVATGFALYLLVGRRTADLLKSRLTYPRTGYAQPPEEVKSLPVGALTTLSVESGRPATGNATSFGWRTVAVVFLFLATPWEGSPGWFPAALVAALAIALYALNRASEHRYSWQAALVLGISGLACLWRGLPPPVRTFLPFALTGLWLVGHGAWTLSAYLQMNPRVPEGSRQ